MVNWISPKFLTVFLTTWLWYFLIFDGWGVWVTRLEYQKCAKDKTCFIAISIAKFSLVIAAKQEMEQGKFCSCSTWVFNRKYNAMKMQNLVFKMAHCFCKYKMGRRMNWGGDEDGGGEAPRGELTLPPQWRSPPSFLPQILPFLSLLGRRHHHPHSANQIHQFGAGGGIFPLEWWDKKIHVGPFGTFSWTMDAVLLQPSVCNYYI